MAYRRERIAPTVLLCFGIAGLIAGLLKADAILLGAGVSAICLAMLVVRENRKDAIAQRMAQINEAARSAERKRINRGN